jgi:general secretion pathway protein D
MSQGNRVCGTILSALLAAIPLVCAQTPATPTTVKPVDDKPIPCSESVAGPCAPTKHSRKQAEKFFKKGQQELNKKRFRDAFAAFSMAAKLSPDSFTYVTQREQARQQIVQQLISDGNQKMSSDEKTAALALFREALELDPGNEFARQRIYDAMPPLPPMRVETKPGSEIVDLKPSPERRQVNVQGPAPAALESVARAFGITAFVDSSVPPTQLNMRLENVTWAEASDIICRASKTFWTPLATNQVLFAKDDDATRRSLQRVALTTLYLYSATPQELNDLSNTLRVMFDIRFIIANAAQGTISIRAPQPVVEAATQFIKQLDAKRPQVLIDVEVFAVAQDLTRQIGTDIPNSFTIFNVPTEAQKLLGGQSIQSIVDQLIASGGINQAATAGLAGLLAQALSGGSSSSLLSQPFATFGGGITLTAITVPGISGKLNVNESTFRSLQHISVRAGHGNPATIKIGQRYPILNGTYAPVYNGPGIANLINSGSYIAPFPSISYEDLGINLKATPKVNREGIVTVELEMQIRALQGTDVNGVPILSNREFKTSLSTKDGESIGVAGLITKSEQRSLSGVPGLSQIPAVGTLFTDRNHSNNDDEVLVVMTPHVVGGVTSVDSPTIALPAFIQR